MVVIGEGMHVEQKLDPVTLVHQAGGVLCRHLGPHRPGLEPGVLQRVHLGEEERLAQVQLKNEYPSRQGLLQIHDFLFLMAMMVKVMLVGSLSSLAATSGRGPKESSIC